MQFNATEISKLKLNSSAFNLRIIEEDVSDIVCKLKNVKSEWISLKQKNNTLYLTVTDEGRMIKRIWNSNSKRIIKILIPKGKVFDLVNVIAGVGVTRIKNIKTEKLKLTCGVGTIQLKNVVSQRKTKIDSGVGKIKMKDCNLKNLYLTGGVGLTQFQGNLTGKIFVSGGVGKIHLTIDSERSEYNIKTKSSFLNNIYIDGFLVKGYRNENSEAKNKIRVAGGIGVVALRFKNKKTS